MELRIADPILLGYDSYHEKASAGGTFRRDLFKLDATVLEVTERNLRPPRVLALNGQGEIARPDPAPASAGGRCWTAAYCIPTCAS